MVSADDGVNMLDYKDVVLYKNLVEQARDIILLISTDGKIVEANQAAVNAYGYSLNELRGMCIYDLRSPDTLSQVDDQIRMAQQKGILFRTFHVRRNGEQFPVEVNSQQVQLPEGEALLSIVRDITEAAALETLLRKSEEKYSVLNEELTAAYEELLASEEELRQQFDELLAREEIISRQNVILTSLHDTAVGLMHKIELDDLLAMIVSSATQLAGTPNGFLSLVDEAAGVFERKAAVGTCTQDITKRIKVTEGLLGRVYRTGKIAIVNDYNTWEHRLRHPFFDEVHYFVIIPLRRGSKVIGALGLAFAEQDKGLAEYEVALLQRFSDLAAIALDNATLVRSCKNELQERRQAEEALKISQSSNQALINAIPDPMFIIKHDGTFVDYKAGKEQLLMPPDCFLGRTVFELFPAETAAKMLQSIELVLANGDIQNFEYQLTVHGKVEHYEVRIIVSGEDEVLAINRNITDRKRMEERLEFLSLHDALTKVYNRAFFEDQMKRIQRLEDGSAGIIICDVDGLKMVNDTLGHMMGDQILQAVAGILASCCSSNDLIARIGGDEFAILLPGNSVKQIASCCQRVREKIDSYNAQNPTVPISLSMGFSACPEPPVDMDALLKQADDSMNREKLHRQKSTRSAIVKALVKALEARDYITEGHGDRLQDLIEAFADIVELPETSIADLRLLARFHDIGKVGIPDSILFKPSRLTEEEWVVMRQHCEIGYRIAVSAPDLVPIADWILKHQEWWNGQGYPLGLKGEAIPIECRMLSIVDAFDAMTSDRPYRQAMSKEDAIAELYRCAGRQFDPNLVDKFGILVQTF
ncbi:diguanylate cyclase [Sporomusa malonica]|uniref:PAS domain S-box-containing protein/diguanylate cyclase (GGDEF) domain-containing protein n=1 Tax=Sporomusa malonica TaxID=112901 RepID=A0A1W2BEB3_9FIRM|nr:diguanylate cyclase [Sporomusa malonica]SMC71062.1 PAS domain S-box-containing protein/diguanylate cyclase (GGDEF) domain-containing protein [Sporomusa malonica]